MKSDLKFLLNGFEINDYDNDPKKLLSTIFENTPNIRFWSPEALKELIINSLEMAAGFARATALEKKRELSAQKQLA